MDTKKQQLRAEYLASRCGDLTTYASMVGDDFAFRVDRLAQILGAAHEPSIGSYKESLLRAVVAESIPRRYSVGTGFIVFIRESPFNDMKSDNVDLWNRKQHYVSRQLDIVVYDDLNFPPIFKDHQFVLVRPESVRSVIEVKGYPSKATVRQAVDCFIDLGTKWSEYRTRYEEQHSGELHSPSLHLMGWNVYVGAKGKAECNGTILRQTIAKEYRKKKVTKGAMPMLSSAYIYADCAVSLCGYAKKTKMMDGYITTRGKFVRYKDNRKPTLAGDSTIASLLAAIQLNLETPFSPDFSYFDQSHMLDVLPHECTGFTDLATGKDITV